MSRFKVGDTVRSVGGFFLEGEIIYIENEILTIKWTKDSRFGDIDLIQKRTPSLVRHLED